MVVSGQDTEVGCHVLLQGIFPTQGLNPGLPHLYHVSYQGSPWMLEGVAYPVSRGPSQLRNQTGVSCIAGSFFYQLSYQGSLGVSGLLFSSPGDLPDPGIKPVSLASLFIGRWSLDHWATWEALLYCVATFKNQKHIVEDDHINIIA